MTRSDESVVEVLPTDDVDALNAVARHPAVFDASSDDYCPSPDLVDLSAAVANPMMRAMGIRAAREWAGFFLLVTHSSCLLEVHTAILPEFRGRTAERAAALCAAYVFEHTRCVKLMTMVPATNRAAALFARRAGFVLEGCLSASFLKGGRLHDQHVLGLTKSAYLSRRRTVA